MRGAGRTTPPHRAPVACGLGTLCRTCGTSWNFASAWQYNHTTWNFVGTLRYFLDICEIFSIQPTQRLARSSLGVMALPMVARPLAPSSRFFVSPLIGGAQQRGLRPRQVLRTLGGPTVLYPRFEPCQIHAKVSLTKLKTRMGSQVPPQSGGWQKGKNVQLYPSHLRALHDLLNGAHLPRQPG
jgi:hypothetical protein